MDLFETKQHAADGRIEREADPNGDCRREVLSFHRLVLREREQVDEKLHHPHGDVHKRALYAEKQAAGDDQHETRDLGHYHVDIQKVGDVGAGKNRFYLRDASVRDVVVFGRQESAKERENEHDHDVDDEVVCAAQNSAFGEKEEIRGPIGQVVAFVRRNQHILLADARFEPVQVHGDVVNGDREQRYGHRRGDQEDPVQIGVDELAKTSGLGGLLFAGLRQLCVLSVPVNKLKRPVGSRLCGGCFDIHYAVVRQDAKRHAKKLRFKSGGFTYLMCWRRRAPRALDGELGSFGRFWILRLVACPWTPQGPPIDGKTIDAPTHLKLPNSDK
ncbi:hypothetical protein KL941_005268 [Ogataea angusta]|nr:hypothetical protein KL941_005268 [Ogataea angusta]